MTALENCPDCGVAVGTQHNSDCDHDRCPDCYGPMGSLWTGEMPEPLLSRSGISALLQAALERFETMPLDELVEQIGEQVVERVCSAGLPVTLTIHVGRDEKHHEVLHIVAYIYDRVVHPVSQAVHRLVPESSSDDFDQTEFMDDSVR